MKVGIVNVTGYAGAELARILHRHPDARIVSVTGRSSAGQKLADVYPHLSAIDITITEDLTESVDVVFSALPHAASAERVGPALDQGAKVVDISADFRLKDLATYEEWYKVQHPYPQYIEEAVYGLPELHRDEIAEARLVANPGCFPTAAILALAPAFKYGLIDNDIIVDAKTGVSGAGRKADVKFLFSEVNENINAYSVSGHRHMPEMAQELQALASDAAPLRVTFVPHLVPMTRGILATCYANLRDGVLPEGPEGESRLRQIYNDFYSDHPFVHVGSKSPLTKQTLGNNDCIVYPTLDHRTGRLIAIGCIDNLVKGAAGAAVQNMNLMFGLQEDSGLQQLAIYP